MKDKNFDIILAAGILGFGFILGVAAGVKGGVLAGTERTHKEAYEHGLMVKEIDHENDKVVYRWIETHKLGYEELNTNDNTNNNEQ